ncbi:hypothetical protein EZV62_004100 [Acer yangbiense]|uniref:EGF-like domain-containing protein n=1 Tax=Acer yangbiense TaxID=1000413 RepID=A0A5C7IJ97_9ROSI|nr:hypothetical protein EZV62_004100 [Acer yangbiense]
MAKFNLNNFSFISLNIFVLSLLLTFCNLTSTSTDELIPNELQGLACALIDCGEGSCVSSDSTFLGFDCVCKPGWKTIQIADLTFPSCLIPNCSINLNCSDVSTLPSLPSACGWCGYGNCAANGTGHTCQCSPGAANLFDNSSLLCLPQCSFGGDCNSLGLGLPVPPPSKSGSTAVAHQLPLNASAAYITILLCRQQQQPVYKYHGKLHKMKLDPGVAGKPEPAKLVM